MQLWQLLKLEFTTDAPRSAVPVSSMSSITTAYTSVACVSFANHFVAPAAAILVSPTPLLCLGALIPSWPAWLQTTSHRSPTSARGC